MTSPQEQPGYPNIFDAANCSLISQLLPAGPKKFLADFMDGNAFRNPIQQVSAAIGQKLSDSMGKIDGFGDSMGELTGDLQGLNDAMRTTNDFLNDLNAHTNRLSGISIDGDNGILPRLDQVIGVMSAYNSVKDLLKDPGDLLEDNFSNAFSSLNPQIMGPFFDNFGSNMKSISGVLANIENQLAQGGLTGPAALVGQLRQLTNNIISIQANITNIMNNDNLAFSLALAAVEKFALGNSIISSVLTDPCYGAQLAKNLILKKEFSDGLDDIAAENGTTIKGTPVELMDHVPSLGNSEVSPSDPVTPTTTNEPIPNSNRAAEVAAAPRPPIPEESPPTLNAEQKEILAARIERYNKLPYNPQLGRQIYDPNTGEEIETVYLELQPDGSYK